jgi:hypothetical protein
LREGVSLEYLEGDNIIAYIIKTVIILKWIFKTWDETALTGLISIRIGAGCRLP